jgi:hypothetical protein
MMRPMRPGLALVLAIAACGGPVGPAAPQDRARVRLVWCKPAVPLPALDGDGEVYGGLIGTASGIAVMGTLSGGTGIGLLGTRAPLDLGAGAGAGAGAPARPAMTVVLGAPSITGAIPAAVIARVLGARTGEMAACASKEPQLLASGSASSKAVVAWRFTVGATGKVIQADVTSPVLSEPIAACVTGVLRGAAFPAPPDGRVVAVTLPIAFDATGTPPDPPDVDPEAPWTPFAMDPAEAARASDQAARAAEGALRKKLAAIDECFASSPVTGSLRAMLAVDSDGALTSVRAGGLGDKAIEACVENAMTGLRVVLPSETSSELSCDLSRGDAQPWRVTTDRGGHGVVEISRTRVRHGDQMLSLGEEPDTLTDHTTYLLVADADAPGALLTLAMRWTGDADSTLVAVRPAGPPGAPPQLLGAGYTATSGQGGDDEEVRATLEVGAAEVTACASRWRQVAKLADPAAIDAAAQKLAARCRTLACSASLVIGVGRDAVGRDLIEVAGAARRAGFERVLFLRGRGGVPADESDDGSPSSGCAPPDGDDEL